MGGRGLITSLVLGWEMVGGGGFGRIVGVGGAHGCSFSIVVFNSH